MGVYFKVLRAACEDLPAYVEYMLIVPNPNKRFDYEADYAAVSVWPFFNVPAQAHENLTRADNGVFYCFTARKIAFIGANSDIELCAPIEIPIEIRKTIEALREINLKAPWESGYRP